MVNEILIITGPAESGKSVLAGYFAKTAKNQLWLDGRNKSAIKSPRFPRLIDESTDLLIFDDITPGYALLLKGWLQSNMLYIKSKQVADSQLLRPRTILIFSEEVDKEVIEAFPTSLPIIRLAKHP